MKIIKDVQITLTKYLQRLLVSTSQSLNSLLGGNPNELLSARAYRTNNKVLMFIINSALFDKNHCKIAYEFEANNDQLPEYKDNK